MSDKAIVHYEIIGKAVVQDCAGPDRHAIRLLYRGDGTPWWTCSSGMDLPVPADFLGKPGDKIRLTVEVLT